MPVESIYTAATERDYGVVFDPAGRAVDAAATERRRAELRRARGAA
jgi:hypothetical protein